MKTSLMGLRLSNLHLVLGRVTSLIYNSKNMTWHSFKLLIDPVLGQLIPYSLYTNCNGDISYNEGLFQGVQMMTITMTDVEYLRLI